MKTKAVILRSLLVLVFALVPSIPALYAQESPQESLQQSPRQLYIPSISDSTEGAPGYDVQATALPYGSSQDIALNYIRSNRASWGLTEADVADMVVKDHYITRHNGVTHTYVRQRWQGIEVFNGDIQVNVAADGSVINYHNKFIADLSSKVNTVEPSLSAVEAVAASVQHLGLQTSRSLEVVENLGGAGQRVRVSDGGISRGPIPASLVYVQRGGVRLAWNVSIELRSGNSWPNLRVDAVTGDILSESDWVQSDAYRVVPMPLESPQDGPGLPASHQLITDTADAVASPFGWHDTNGVAGPEFHVTNGNNVSAQEDTNADDAGGFQPSETTPDALVFDYPFDASLAPTGGTNQQAAIVNLFYQNNIVHDILYQYGFDEVSGNFQFNNYERGGLGNDPVQADAQDGSSVNNANFGTPPDGESPRMQMFEFNLTDPHRDSDLDNGVIAHEYGHGVSVRLTGGPSNVECLNNQEQMGEGWSDFIALMLTAKPGQVATEARGMGTYVLGQPVNGPGIRLFPYSTDLEVNPQTYDDIKAVAIPHGVGSVWAEMLWEMYGGLVEEHGFDADLYNGNGGNNLAMQLVIDGMKLQTCSPGFVDGRNAILLADQVNNAGANQCTIWEAFAKRGLGFSANQGDSGSVGDGSEAFDLPRNCVDELQLHKSVSPSIAFADSLLTYAVTATNYTSITLSGVVITDAVPAGTTYVANSASEEGSEAGGVVTWNVGGMDVDEVAARTFAVTVDSPTAPPGVIFTDDMENDGSGWAATGLWHQETGAGNCSNSHSPTTSWYYGDAASCTYDTGAANQGTLTTVDPLALPVGVNTLRFWSWEQTEGFAGFDTRTVLVSTNGTTFIPVWQSQDNSAEWYSVSVDLSEYAGKNIWLRFAFNTIDDTVNAFRGWYVDNVLVVHEPSLINTAYVTSDQAMNDTVRVVTRVIIPPDITVDPASLAQVLQPGEVATPTLTIGNVGEPDSLLEGSIAAPLVGWLRVQPSHFTLAQGESIDVAVEFNASGLETGVFTATLLLDSNDVDESQVAVPVTLTVPTLALDKVATPVVAYAGDIVTYTLTARNGTASVLTGVVITDAVPANTTYVAGSASDGGSEAGGVVTWNLGTMAIDEVATRSFAVTIASPFPPPIISFEDDMENDGGGWIATGLWHQETGAENCSNSHSPTTSWYYGDATSCTYSTGAVTAGELTTAAPILLSAEASTLKFWSWERTEDFAGYDTRTVLVSTNGTDFVPVWESTDNRSKWYQVSVDLSAYTGMGIWLRFAFDSVDNSTNNFTGWYIDDVEIATESNVINTAYIVSEQGMTDAVAVVTPVIIPPEITIVPESLVQSLPPGEVATQTLTISNTGALASILQGAVDVLLMNGVGPDFTSVSQPTAAQAVRERAIPARAWAESRLSGAETVVREPSSSFDAEDLPVILSDPAGDGGTACGLHIIDATVVRGRSLGGELQFAIDFDAPIDAADFGGYLYIDSDQNSATGLAPGTLAGKPTQTVGIDYYVSLFELFSGVVSLYDANQDFVAGYAAEVDAQQIRFAIPLADTGHDDGNVNIAGVLGDSCSATEWIPDEGHATVTSWLSALPSTFYIKVGDHVTLDVRFDATGLDVGKYDAVLLFQSNDKDEDLVYVPVTLFVNNAPDADDDAASTDEDTPVTIDVLANDSDVDGDSLSVESVTQPDNGSATTNGTTVAYTPTANFNGEDGLIYSVSDGHGGIVTATVTITVEAVSDAPQSVTISGPSTGEAESSHTFTASVDFATLAQNISVFANLPVTFTWQATEQLDIVHTGTTSDVVSFAWTTPGEKTVSVTVANADGQVSSEEEVTIFTGSFVMTKTVFVDGYREKLPNGTFNPSTCALSSSITVPAGTTVKYCYTITNTGEHTLTTHSLVDNRFAGAILDSFSREVGPGESFSTVDIDVEMTQTLTVSTTNVATWTAEIATPELAISPAAIDAVVGAAIAEVTISAPGQDQDGDGRSDSAEGSGDANANGIPDFLDPAGPTEQPTDRNLFIPSVGKH